MDHSNRYKNILKLYNLPVRNDEEKIKLIKENHESPGHLNARTTYKLLKNYYFWIGMFEDVKDILRSFWQCEIFYEGEKINMKYLY